MLINTINRVGNESVDYFGSSFYDRDRIIRAGNPIFYVIPTSYVTDRLGDLLLKAIEREVYLGRPGSRTWQWGMTDRKRNILCL